jgi:hypothetical protein
VFRTSDAPMLRWMLPMCLAHAEAEDRLGLPWITLDYPIPSPSSVFLLPVRSMWLCFVFWGLRNYQHEARFAYRSAGFCTMTSRHRGYFLSPGFSLSFIHLRPAWTDVMASSCSPNYQLLYQPKMLAANHSARRNGGHSWICRHLILAPVSCT